MATEGSPSPPLGAGRSPLPLSPAGAPGVPAAAAAAMAPPPAAGNLHIDPRRAQALKPMYIYVGGHCCTLNAASQHQLNHLYDQIIGEFKQKPEFSGPTSISVKINFSRKTVDVVKENGERTVFELDDIEDLIKSHITAIKDLCETQVPEIRDHGGISYVDYAQGSMKIWGEHPSLLASRGFRGGNLAGCDADLNREHSEFEDRMYDSYRTYIERKYPDATNNVEKINKLKKRLVILEKCYRHLRGSILEEKREIQARLVRNQTTQADNDRLALLEEKLKEIDGLDLYALSMALIYFPEDLRRNGQRAVETAKGKLKEAVKAELQEALKSAEKEKFLKIFSRNPKVNPTYADKVASLLDSGWTDRKDIARLRSTASELEVWHLEDGLLQLVMLCESEEEQFANQPPYAFGIKMQNIWNASSLKKWCRFLSPEAQTTIVGHLQNSIQPVRFRAESEFNALRTLHEPPLHNGPDDEDDDL